jgi:hypothetical protein
MVSRPPHPSSAETIVMLSLNETLDRLYRDIDAILDSYDRLAESPDLMPNQREFLARWCAKLSRMTIRRWRGRRIERSDA